MHIPKYIIRSGAALIVILILGIGALLWAALIAILIRSLHEYPQTDN